MAFLDRAAIAFVQVKTLIPESYPSPNIVLNRGQIQRHRSGQNRVTAKQVAALCESSSDSPDTVIGAVAAAVYLATVRVTV
ncbi:MAG: hypothetical protein M3Y72_03265, partial [Acidobacteriota bacterium]|nr:hypothetical protein [Acidobacteriota bacterium]